MLIGANVKCFDAWMTVRQYQRIIIIIISIIIIIFIFFPDFKNVSLSLSNSDQSYINTYWCLRLNRLLQSVFNTAQKVPD